MRFTPRRLSICLTSIFLPSEHRVCVFNSRIRSFLFSNDLLATLLAYPLSSFPLPPSSFPLSDLAARHGYYVFGRREGNTTCVWSPRCFLTNTYLLQRFVLGEMIKVSTIDVATLVDFIRNHQVEPNWMLMQLPGGMYSGTAFTSISP